MHGNKISFIDPEPFNGLTNLITIGLTYNKLTKLDQKALIGLPKLQSISFEGNQINFIDTRAFNELTNLEYISFFENNLTQINPFELYSIFFRTI